MCARISVLAQSYINDNNGRQLHVWNKTWYNLCRAFIGPGGDQYVARFKKYQSSSFALEATGCSQYWRTYAAGGITTLNKSIIEHDRAWYLNIRKFLSEKRGRVHVWPPRSPDLTLKLFFCILACCVRWRLKGKYLKKIRVTIIYDCIIKLYKVLVGSPKEREHSENQGVDGIRMNLR
jgi:hypothetical protein